MQTQRTHTELNSHRLCITSTFFSNLLLQYLIKTYGVLPLHLFIKQTGVCTYAKLQHLLPCEWEPTTKAKKYCAPHRKYWEETFQKWIIPLGEDDHCSAPAGNRNFTLCVDSFSDEAKFKKHTQLNVYTDGS